MASQDLQIHRRVATPASPRFALQPNLVVEEESGSSQVLLSALRRYWWLFFLIAGVSGAAAYQAAQFFGKDSSVTTASLIQTGLPGPPSGVDVFEPLGPGTCAEIMTSINVLNELRRERGLEVPTTRLQELITTQSSRGSSLLHVEFAWSDAREGVEILNDLLDIFVNQVAEQRRNTLREHMRHVEAALLKVNSEVADAREQILQIHARQREALEEGGLNSDRYRSLLSSVSNTQFAVDDARSQQLGIYQQIEAIDDKLKSLDAQAAAAYADVKDQVRRKIATRIERMRDQYVETSASYAEITQLLKEIEVFTNAEDAPRDIRSWETELFSKLAESRRPFSENELQEIASVLSTLVQTAAPTLQSIELERQQQKNNKQKLELSVIPLKNQIQTLDSRLAEYQGQAEGVGEQLTGIGADEFGTYELRLEQAETQQKALTMQLDNMSQLEKCRVREWAVSAPASLQTTQVSSNYNKIFVLAFGLCALALSAPVFLSEWHRQQTSPQVAFANSLRLPVLAERIMHDLSARGRRFSTASLNENQLETVRTLALRIQQSSPGADSVVLFSSIDPRANSAPLVAAVAQCLAEREEKVLIVDAICPKKTNMPITNVVAASSQKNAKRRNSKAKNQRLASEPGLAEYLTLGSDSVHDLVRPTGCPGVDIISSGQAAFPREAMASSSLTELVDRCRESYTIILVNSPAATASADLQMLAARADGIVLTATKSVHKDRVARAAVIDLIELGAPIIGVVA